MKQIVPYSKNIIFNNKISEITSISLEHTFNSDEDEIYGDFIVSGEYKSHELSVNKESFNYKLPFNVDITENIIKESLKMDIVDFAYDILKDNTLKVDIDFSIEAKEKESISEDTTEVLPFIEPEVDRDEIVDIMPLEESSKSVVIEQTSTKEDSYITYKVYIVRELDTFESIALKYNVSDSFIKEYNKVDSLSYGDKLLIPIYGD